jgi:hypothetical protein
MRSSSVQVQVQARGGRARSPEPGPGAPPRRRPVGGIASNPSPPYYQLLATNYQLLGLLTTNCTLNSALTSLTAQPSGRGRGLRAACIVCRVFKRPTGQRATGQSGTGGGLSAIRQKGQIPAGLGVPARLAHEPVPLCLFAFASQTLLQQPVAGELLLFYAKAPGHCQHSEPVQGLRHGPLPARAVGPCVAAAAQRAGRGAEAAGLRSASTGNSGPDLSSSWTSWRRRVLRTKRPSGTSSPTA